MKKFTIICMFPAFNYETNLYSREILKNFKYVKNKNDENIDIYFNDTLKQITIYIQFNAYIKESIELVKQFIDSIDN